MMPRERLTPKEVQVATLVWEGLINREIGKLMGTTEQVITNHLRSTFDKVGVGVGSSWPCTLPPPAARTGWKSRNGRCSDWSVPPLAKESGSGGNHCRLLRRPCQGQLLQKVCTQYLEPRREAFVRR
jgi:Bacterial regulatory proteins, luxR family